MKQFVTFMALVCLARGQDWGDEDVCHHDCKEKAGARGLGDAADADAASAVTPLDQTNFEEGIATGIVFVKFFLPYFKFCKDLAPTWEQLAEDYASTNGVKIAGVDCDAEINKQLCDAQGVSGFPTLILYKDGQKVEILSGNKSLDSLKELVVNNLVRA
jgi:thioredoxin-like negative regulator of GroEL